MAGSRSVVLAALVANGSIAVMKFVGFALTGSPSMLSETYHSVSDTGNQVFLLVGIEYSEKEAGAAHPFGYGKAQFFYSFLVSVLLFGIAGWESTKHGYNALTSHGGHGGERQDFVVGSVNVTELVAVDPFWVNVVVLLGAIGFETWALWKANKELTRQREAYGWETLREAFTKTSDVTTLTAFTEDTIALAGAAIALAGIVLARVFDAPIFDAIAALLIGLLLMGFAVALAWQNKRLLLGESVADDVEYDIRTPIEETEGVATVDSLKTMFVGPGKLLVAADVVFDDGLDTTAIEARIDDIEGAVSEADDRVTYVYVEPEDEETTP